MTEHAFQQKIVQKGKNGFESKRLADDRSETTRKKRNVTVN